MKMNENQKMVIENVENSILLLASAGTGKTNTLALRIGNIIKQGKAEPNEILCITFTNKACTELRERISSIVGEAANGVIVKTFHSFCLNFLKFQYKRNGMPGNFTVIDEDDTMEIIRNSHKYKLQEKTIKNFIDIIKMKKEELGILSDDLLEDIKKTIDITLKDPENIKKISSNSNENHLDLTEFFTEKGPELVYSYMNRLNSYKALDFNDLINLTYKYLKDKEIKEECKRMFKYVNCDEVQDTSVKEFEIIEHFIGENTSFLLTGDTFQTIYSWRGSNPKLILEKFVKTYNPIKISLDTNYRSTENIMKFSVDYLNRAFPKEMKLYYNNSITVNNKEKGDKIKYYEAEDVADEAYWIMNEIMKLSEEEKKKVAILSRNNNYNIMLSDHFRKFNTPLNFALVDDIKFFRKSEIKDIIAFLKLYLNRADGVALKRIINKLSYYIGEATFNKIDSEVYYNNGIILSDLIDLKILNNKDKFKILLDEFKNDNIIVFDVESTGVNIAKDEIIQIAAIKLNYKGEEIDRFVKFIKPKNTVGDSVNVHGFSDEFLNANGEEKRKVLTDFANFAKDSVIVGHNVQFDINILRSELERNSLPQFNFIEFYDTLDIYRRFYPELTNHKLSTLSNIFQVQNKPDHNAINDILATAELLTMVINNKIIPTAKERIALMDKIPEKFYKLATDLNKYFNSAENKRPKEIIQLVVKGFELNKGLEEGNQHLTNMRELYFIAETLDDLSLSPTDALYQFVELTALSNGDLEKMLLVKGNRIPIITVHQAKGLEFESVFIAGLTDYTFPTFQAIKYNNLEEEKKLFYVSITRGKKRIYLSNTAKDKYKNKNRSQLLDNVNFDYIECCNIK